MIQRIFSVGKEMFFVEIFIEIIVISYRWNWFFLDIIL